MLPILLLLLNGTPALTTHPSPGLPFVINTWSGPFTDATNTAYTTLLQQSSSTSTTTTTAALDAVQAGCAACEAAQCDHSVGYGGSPDEACETTLDAQIMDGTTLNVGAVAGLRRVRDAMAAARLVLDATRHSLLVGDAATRFAVDFGGLVEGDLATPESRALCEAWRRREQGACQPNFWTVPGAESGCGPYRNRLHDDDNALSQEEEVVMELKGRAAAAAAAAVELSHDTISMIAIHADGTMASGTSTNGATHKIPGRVGDGPITGSGSYVDGEVGGCGATGDGDVMMRFLPCYQAVESMRRGMAPQEAAEDAVRRMLRRYPDVKSGVVVVDREGRFGGAASGWQFTYSYRGGSMEDAEVVTVQPLTA